MTEGLTTGRPPGSSDDDVRERRAGLVLNAWDVFSRPAGEQQIRAEMQRLRSGQP